MRNSFLLIISLGLLFSSCDKALLGPEIENTPESNFEYFWKDYSDHYANFRVKNIDWDAVYEEYRPQITASSTDEDLFNVLTSMQELLNDGHVSLYTGLPDITFYGSGPGFALAIQDIYPFYEKSWVEPYLVNEINSLGEDQIIYGLLEDNLGYLYIGEMYEDLKLWGEVMDDVVAQLGDTDGLVLDLRDNGGGEDEAGRFITSYFTDSEAPYQNVRFKNGPGPNDFEEVRRWSIAPGRSTLYTKPIAVITDRYCISAGETFALALKTLPQMIHVGDTTTGAFSDTNDRELPNLWKYRIPVAEVKDQNEISYEGIGLIPEHVVRNTNEEIANGVDKMLEKAIEVLQ